MSSVRVKLYNDWRGYHRDEVISVTKDVARALVNQVMAEYEKPKEIKEKNLKGAVKDKMLKTAPKSK